MNAPHVELEPACGGLQGSGHSDRVLGGPGKEPMLKHVLQVRDRVRGQDTAHEPALVNASPVLGCALIVGFPRASFLLARPQAVGGLRNVLNLTVMGQVTALCAQSTPLWLGEARACS